jgi:hypothetical protein
MPFLSNWYTNTLPLLGERFHIQNRINDFLDLIIIFHLLLEAVLSGVHQYLAIYNILTLH